MGPKIGFGIPNRGDAVAEGMASVMQGEAEGLKIVETNGMQFRSKQSPTQTDAGKICKVEVQVGFA